MEVNKLDVSNQAPAPIAGLVPLFYMPATFWALVFVLTLAGSIAGVIASLVILILAIVLLPVMFLKNARHFAVSELLPKGFLLAPLLLLVAFSLTARGFEDLQYIFNFVSFILAIPVFVLARNMASLSSRKLFVVLCLAGSVLAVIVGLYDTEILNIPRAQGFLTGANIYARMAVLLGFIAGTGYFVFTSRWRFLFLMGPVLGIVSLVMSGSRGVALAVPALLLVYVGAIFVSTSAKQRRNVIIGGLLLAVLTLAALVILFDVSRMYNAVQPIIKTITGAEITDSSTTIRIQLYTAGWTLFTQSPLIGHGWFRPDLVVPVIRQAFPGLDAVGFFAFHNDFLQFAAGAGLLGIVALFLILTTPLFSVFAQPRDALFVPKTYAILVLVILYSISGLFDFVLGFAMPTTAFAMMSAIILGLFHQIPTETHLLETSGALKFGSTAPEIKPLPKTSLKAQKPDRPETPSV